jgi:nucleotide-binding universal stress UspA family protein
LMAPPLLRWSLSHVKIGSEEAARLESEELAATSFVGSMKRALVPIPKDYEGPIAALLVQNLRRQQAIEVTLLEHVTKRRGLRALFSDRSARKSAAGTLRTAERARELMRTEGATVPDIQTVSARNLGAAVVDEAKKGYDLIVIEAPEGGVKASSNTITHWIDRVVSEAAEVADPRRFLFEDWIDHVVQNAPCATVVVKGPMYKASSAPPSLRRILVPTVGTTYSMQAVELAAVTAAGAGAKLTIVHVVARPAVDVLLLDSRKALEARNIGGLIVDRQAALARKLGAEVDTRVLEGTSSEDEILALAAAGGYDLIVIGSNLRHISGRAFFGHHVDTTLARANCPVAIVSS